MEWAAASGRSGRMRQSFQGFTAESWGDSVASRTNVAIQRMVSSRPALLHKLGRPPGLLLGRGLIEGHGGPNERLQRRLVDLLALVEVDRAPGVALETGIEELRRVFQ